jgi:hypothetical protein
MTPAPRIMRATPEAMKGTPSKPVLAKAAGFVDEVARRVPVEETSKYRTLVIGEPSDAVELKVRVCQPEPKLEGNVTEVLTAPLTAFPVPIVCGVDRTTTVYGAVAWRPLATIATEDPATNWPCAAPRVMVASGAVEPPPMLKVTVD